jgi:hypothetical protein
MTEDPMDQQVEQLQNESGERAQRLRKFVYHPNVRWLGGGRSALLDDVNALEQRIRELTDAAHELCKSSGPLSMYDGIEFVASSANSKMMDVLYGPVEIGEDEA